MKRVHVVVRGEVQGVFFRDGCRAEAQRRGVSGWVCNEYDGTVSAELEGEPDQVDAVVDWCRHGPRHARVDGVDVTDVEATGSSGFRVR